MKPSRILQRGAKGYGWYYKYMKEGKEGFQKHRPPTPFNWNSESSSRSKVYFDLSSGNSSIGRLTFELVNDLSPRMVENFQLLVKGDTAHSYCYKGTKIHNVSKGSFIMGGDVECNDGSGTHSAYQNRYIEDEFSIIPHSERGLLSMASVGRDTCGSQFYITLGPNPQMDGRCIVIGKVVEGDTVLNAIEQTFTFRGYPMNDIVIEDAGIVTNGA